MADSEDGAAAAEAHFEALRRFVDERNLASRQQRHAQGPDSAHVPPVQLTFAAGSEAEAVGGVSPGLQQPDTANPAFNKLAGVLAYLCAEVARLREHAELRVFPLLLMFGEGLSSPPEPATSLAAALPGLRDAAALAEAVQAVALNLLCQLGGLCAEHTRKATILQGDTAHTVFEAAGEALGVLLRLDVLVQRVATLPPATAAMRRLLAAAAEDSSLWDGNSEDAQEADALADEIADVEATFCGAGSGSSFRRFLEAQVAAPAVAELFAGSTATTVLPTTLRSLFASLLGRWGGAGEAAGDWARLTGLVALAAAVAWLGGAPPDRKLLRLLQELHLQVPLLDICRGATATPGSLLSRLLPLEVASQLPSNFLQAGTGAVRRGSQALLRGVALAAAVSRWAQMPPALAEQLRLPLPPSQLTHIGRAVALLKGMEATFQHHGPAIAALLPHAVTAARADLAALATAARRAAMPGGSDAGAPLLALPGARQRRAAALDDAAVAAALMCRLAAGPVSSQQLLLLRLGVDALRATAVLPQADLVRLTAAVDDIAGLADVQAGMWQACDCSWLYGSLAQLRRLLGTAAREAGGAQRLLRLLAAAADCGQLLRHCSPPAPLQALDDLLRDALETAVLEPAVTAVESHMRLALFAVDAACASKPDGAGAAAAKAAAEAAAQALWVAPLVALPPLRLVVTTVQIRQRLGVALTRRLHENAAVAPQDGARLREAAALAASTYDLPVAPPRLPAAGPNGGVDVLDVICGMDVFAARFAYSAATHAFVQRPAAAPPGAPYLSVLTPDFVAGAVRTHGLGLLPAAINAAYKFLGTRLAVLSQVLFREDVAGRLQMEARWWRGAHGGLGSLYPPHRAARLTADLAGPPDGTPGGGGGEQQSDAGSDAGTGGGSVVSGAPPPPEGEPPPLQQLRLLVTEIGNALGFVRLCRQAGLRVAAAAAQLEPQPPPASGSGTDRSKPSGAGDRETADPAAPGAPPPPPRLAECPEIANLKGPLGPLAEAFDDFLADMRTQAAEGMDFFPPLVSVFSKELCTPENRHLRLFHMAAPAVAAAAVEAGLVAKEALTRRRRGGAPAGFTNDGFPLGLAFLLKVLEQETAFDSLQWFEAVAAYYTAEAATIAERPPAAHASPGGLAARLLDGLSSTLRGGGGSPEKAGRAAPAPADEENRQLALARVRAYTSEYELLANTLAAVRMFFAEADD